MPEALIRPMWQGDGEGLTQCWLDAGAYYAAIDPELFQVPEAASLVAWFEESLDHVPPDTCRFVAELDGAVVGFVIATLQQPLESAPRQFVRDVGRVRLEVSVLVVRQAHWRRGIGASLMRAAEQWGRSRGAEIALLDTYVKSEVSVPFYERRMGYRRRSLRFRKRLT